MGNSSRPLGPFGIDPLHFSFFLLSVLLTFVLYLLLPRGFRVHHFRSYPKRYAWSARSRAARGRSGSRNVGGGFYYGQPPGSTAGASSIGTGSVASHNPHHRHLQAQGIPLHQTGGGSSSISAGSQPPSYSQSNLQRRNRSGIHDPGPNEETITFEKSGRHQGQHQLADLQQNDEIVISAAMQQLRDPGVLIIAHGSRGKPKTVRLQLTESAITWRTETRKKVPPGSKDPRPPPKMGKLHQVPLSHIMYVDVGKQTTALRRVENAGVSEALCFSLLTKEGSLDLEANSPRERDALVSCFSLVLDEVHAQNWRDIYRGPSSDMPSSFDDFETDEAAAAAAAAAAGGQHGAGV